ncbi:6123_t:CDS:2, partial [Racocetra persica]
METSISDEQNDDYEYIVELSHNTHENYEQNESDEDENYDAQDDQLEDERIESHDIKNIQLPSPPSFNMFQHLRPTHEFTLNLPTKYEFALSSPYLIFSLFFSSEQISTIVQNTNEYAYIKGAEEGHRWEKLTDLINASMEESSQTKKPNTRSRVEKLVRFNDKNDDHSTKR